MGGSSYDTEIVSDIMLPNPFIIHVLAGGSYQWSKQISPEKFDDVKNIAYNSDETKLVATMYPFTIIVLETSTGTLLRSYDEPSTVIKGISYQGTLAINSNDIAFVGMESGDNKWQIIAIDLTLSQSASLTPYLFYKATTAPSKIMTIRVNGNRVYLGGVMRQPGDSKIYATFSELRASQRTLTFNYGYGQAQSGKYMMIKRITYYNNYVFAALQYANIDTSTYPNYLRVAKFDASNSLKITYIVELNLPQISTQSSGSNVYACEQINAFAVDQIGLLLYIPNTGETYFAQIKNTTSWLGNIYTFTYYKVGVFADGRTTFGYRRSGSNTLYFSGSASSITNSPTVSQSKMFGFVMSVDYTSSCYSSLPLSLGNPSYLQPISSSYVSLTSETFSQTYSGLTAPSITISYTLSTSVISNQVSCSGVSPTYTIIDSLSAQTYTLYSGPVTYPVTDYTVSGVSGCTDLGFVYIGVGLPEFVTFDPSIKIITVDTDQTYHAGTYTIKIQGTMTNGQTHLGQFALTVTDPCTTSATINSPAFTGTPYTYVFGSLPLIIIPTPLFASSIPQCALEFELQDLSAPATYTPYSGTDMSFLASTQEIYVYTNDLTYVSAVPQTYRVKASLSTNSAVVVYANFQIQITSQCDSATLITNAIPPYYLLNTETRTFKLNWVPSAIQCTNIVAYSISTLSTLPSSIGSATVDISTGIVTLESLTVEPNPIAYTITIDGQLDGSVTLYQQTFDIRIGPYGGCDSTRVFQGVITSPRQYLIGGPDLVIIFDEWIDPVNPSCISFTYTIFESINQPIASPPVYSYDSMTRAFTFSTTDLNNGGLSMNFVISGAGTISGSSIGAPLTQSFDIMFYNPCQPPFQTFTPDSTPISGTHSYYISDPTMTITFPNYQTTYPESLCGTTIYELKKSSGASLDGDVMTFDDTLLQLYIQTDDNTKYSSTSESYSLIVYSANYPSNKFKFTFKILITKDCYHNRINLPSPDTVTISVKIGASINNDISLSDFSLVVLRSKSGSKCSNLLTFTCIAVSGTDACSANYYQVINSNKILRVTSTDINMLGIVHQVKVKANIGSSVVDNIGYNINVQFVSDLCPNQYIMPYPIDTFTYDVSYGIPNNITQLAWDKSDPGCPNITYQVYDKDRTGNVLDSEVFTFDSSNNQIYIFTVNPSKAKIYHLYIVGQMAGITKSLDFTVQVTNICPTSKLTTPPISDIIYELTDNPKTQVFLPWSFDFPTCGEFTYLLKRKDNYPVDTFITLDEATQQISVYSEDLKDEGNYLYLLVGTSIYRTFQLPFQVKIINKCYQATLQPPQQPSVNSTYFIGSQPLVLKVETLKDSMNGACGQITYEPASILPNYVKFTSNELTLYTNDKSLDGYTANFDVKATLQASSSTQTISYSILIMDLNPTMQEALKEFQLIDISQSGGKGVNQNKKVMKPTLNATITYIDFNQRVTIQFNKQMKIPSDIGIIEKLKAFSFLVVQMPGGKLMNIVQSWRVESYSDKIIVVKLFFEDVNQISINKEYDKLRVTFRHNQIFQSFDQESYPPISYTMTKQIGPQLGNSTAMQMLQTAAETMSKSLTGSVSMNLILATLLGVSLKKVWMLMNTLQILTNIPLLSIALPSNALFTLQSLSDLAKMNLIPKDKIKQQLKEISLSNDSEQSADGKVKSNFKTMGFESTNIFENIGLIFFVLVGFVAVAIILLLLRAIIKRFAWAQKFYDKIHRKIFFNSFLRSIQKGYLNFSIATMIALQDFSNEPKQQAISILLALVLLSTPIWTTLFLQSSFGKLEEEEFNLRYGSLYLNLKSDHRPALYHTCLYFLRRLSFAFAIVFLGDFTYLQFYVLMLSSSALLGFQLRIKPMDDRASQILEVYNEFTILFIACLTGPYVQDMFDVDTQESNQKLGWIISGVVLFNLLVNQIVMVAAVFMKFLSWVKKKFCKSKLKKDLKKSKEKYKEQNDQTNKKKDVRKNQIFNVEDKFNQTKELLQLDPVRQAKLLQLIEQEPKGRELPNFNDVKVSQQLKQVNKDYSIRRRADEIIDIFSRNNRLELDRKLEKPKQVRKLPPMKSENLFVETGSHLNLLGTKNTPIQWDNSELNNEEQSPQAKQNQQQNRGIFNEKSDQLAKMIKRQDIWK